MTMKIEENFSLRSYNTFGIDASAKWFSGFSDAEQLDELVSLRDIKNILVLGGGSNVLFTGNFNGLVLFNAVRGIELIKEDDHHVYVRVGAGENWHQFVLYCLQRNWAGIENLSLIPGSVGAGPIQNIGAYGVELKEVFYELEAFHLKDRKVRAFSVNDCAFGYRDSVFKSKWRNQYAILNVTLRMNKNPVFHTNYGAIEEELKKMNVTSLTIQAVSDAVIRIRSSKLPDPAKIGNAGSFFKNPQVPVATFDSLHKKYPGLPGYKSPGGSIKLAAGWLIEQCGWKGYRKGDAGCHEKQALVLVNYGQATGAEILSLSEEIARSVKIRFGVGLEREVNVV
jgi:UDP-N-acetylmuramate dehydrogenase